MSATKKVLASDFFAVIEGSNPYSVERVCNPDDLPGDVDEIHSQQFKMLCELAEDAYRNRPGIGVMLMGPVGVGKSHLLSRFCRWAAESRAIYLYLHNVIASPQSMPRHFLRSIVSLMVEGRESFRQSPLYRIVQGTIKRITKAKRLTTAQARAAWFEACGRFEISSGRLNTLIFEVLYKFFETVSLSPELRGPTRELVDAIVDWLSGESINEEMAKKIGLDPSKCRRDDEGLIRLADDSDIMQVLLIICEASWSAQRAVVVCLDQFDNLQTEQVRSFSQFLHALIDNSRNLLVVTAGVQQTLVAFHDEQIITESQWDRLASRIIELTQISPVQARQLVLERLKPIQGMIQADTRLKGYLKHHAFFPLSEKDYEQRFGEALQIKPRSVIAWAREAWRRERVSLRELGPDRWLENWIDQDEGSSATSTAGNDNPPEKESLDSVINKKVDEAINERIAELREHAGSLPPNADNLATLVERLVDLCANRDGYSVKRIKRITGDKPAYHLEVEEGIDASTNLVRTAVAMLVTRDGRSARGALNRLLNTREAFDHRVLVTDEDRAPLPMTPVTKELYSDLTRLGDDAFRHIKLTFQQYVELDALRSVVDQAEDLIVEDEFGRERSLDSREVIEALHRLDRFRKHPLLCELVTEPNVTVPVSTEVNFPDQSLVRSIVLGELAWNISITSNSVTLKALSQCPEPHAEFEMVHERVLEFVQSMSNSNEVQLKDHLNGKLILSAAQAT